jgi:serine/threonine protein kinase/tetratricopeptide (TPR) repeat protein
MIGRTFSHYRITAKLGSGGMGEVYLATDTKLDRQVAVKFLSADRSGDPEARQRFIHEAKAQAMLSHPNIATFIDVGEEGGRAFLVIEYVEGHPLPQLAHEERLSLPEILDLVIQVGEGLQSAHEHGVIHRDIKPENILVTAKRQVKITDFGLARWKGATTLTKDGTRMGTAYYMSPEQAEGKRVDRRSDLFSLGVILYELVCGQRPFEGETETAIAYAVVSETPEPLARYKAGVPEELQHIVSKCLVKNPEERYQSAAELLADLKALRRTLTGASGAPPSKSFAAKRSRKVALVVVAGVAVVVVVAVLLTRHFLSTGPGTAIERKMLAVLPFQNLGAPEDEYFADGITEEITSRLAKISGLRVISRTSAQQYKKTEKSLRQIGSELGANYVLEGTIRWDKSGATNVVRITPQLIQVSDDSHIWAENYERTLTQIFAVQASIAEQVAHAMNLALLEGQRNSLAAAPTTNLDAYDSYLRGLDYASRGLAVDNLKSAAAMFENAVSLDSTFALAFAWLARVETWLFFFSPENPETSLDMAQEALARAFRLAPDLPEAFLAQGVYDNLVLREYDRALESFDRARQGLGNFSDLYQEIALVRKRQGKLLESVSNYLAALELDPRSLRKLLDLADTYAETRRYGDAERVYDRAAALVPDDADVFAGRLTLCLYKGDTAGARRVLEAARPYIDPVKVLWRSWADLGGPWRFRLYPDVMQDPQGRLARAILPDPREWCFLPLAEIYTAAGESGRARVYYDSAMIGLQATLARYHALIAKKGLKHQDDFYLHYMLGFVAARLGMKDLAIEEGRRSMELMPVQSCFW